MIMGVSWEGGTGMEMVGHSCNIGNAPNFGGKKLKTVICEF